MELMSSLLLFALTLLPQTLGQSKGKFSYDVNNSISNKRKANQNILFNVPPTTAKVSDLQSVFTDASCKTCINCMERAIRAHKTHNHIIEVEAEGEALESLRREKRNVDDNKMKIKKSKSKKNKLITVFKYVGNGKVYALKVKESSTHFDTNITRLQTKCEVYKVQQFYPCETPAANLILKGPKINKKNKKEQSNNDTNVHDATDKTVLLFKKRQIEELQNPEHFLSSVEENIY